MEVEATFELRILASLLILIPALAGLVLHTLLGWALYKGWKTFYKNSFYVITVQLQWCDVCALVLDLYIAFPLSLTGDQYMGDSITLYYGPLVFEGVAFNGLFLLSFFLSTNRFLLFIFPRVHNKVFTYWGTRITSLTVWIYVIVFIGLSNVFGCRKQFSKDEFYFWYNCSNRVSGEFHYNDVSVALHAYDTDNVDMEILYTEENFMDIQSYLIPAAMIVMYAIVFVKIKTSLQGGMRSDVVLFKHEVRYLTQTVLIGILIIVEVAAFVTVPFLNVGGYGQFYLNILLNLIVIANNLITPIVVLSFNSDIRYYVFSSASRPQKITTLIVTNVM
ncbi:hypothetical protein OSTOST_10422, partial [Ostertagia ostertagi]